MSAGSCRCIECGADVSWMAGQSPALWCPRCRPSAEEAYEAGRLAAVRDFWRSVCLEIADRLERNRWQLNEMKLSFEQYLAADEMLTAHAAQLRAWAGET